MRHSQIRASLCSSESTAATPVKMAGITTSGNITITPITKQQHLISQLTPHPLWKSSPLSPKTLRRQSATSTSTAQIPPAYMPTNRPRHLQTRLSTSPTSAPTAPPVRIASVSESTPRLPLPQPPHARLTANSSQTVRIQPVHSDIPAFRPAETAQTALSRGARTRIVRCYADSIRA